jgi:hypothetical protein
MKRRRQDSRTKWDASRMKKNERKTLRMENNKRETSETENKEK